MTLKSYLWRLRGGTLIIFCAWLSIVFFTTPEDLGVFAWGTFYGTLLLWTCGLNIILLTHLWNRITHNSPRVGELSMAMRQGILIGILLTVLVAFQHLRILTWWDALLVTVGVFLVELFFLTGAEQ